MGTLDMMEEGTVQIGEFEQNLPMMICEDGVDLSSTENDEAEMVSDAICNTKVGGVLDYLQDRLTECMVAHYCEDEPTEDNSGESIFESDSLMGLPLEEREDHWIHDETIATWTRIIVVPRKELHGQQRSPRPRPKHTTQTPPPNGGFPSRN